MKVYLKKVYLIVDRGEDTWVEAACTTRRIAERYLEREVQKAYSEAVAIHNRRKKMADAWLAAGGGLSVSIHPVPTLEEFAARWSWVIEECDLYEALPE